MSGFRRRLMMEKKSFEYVDLGLSVLWATGNLTKDASDNYSIAKPTEYGAYFSWGDIEGHNVVGQNEGYNFSKSNFNNQVSGQGSSLSASFTSGDATYDAARANLGSPWRMPTGNEIEELVSSCTWNWKESGNSDYNGVAGYEVVGTNGNKIFLPCAGYCSNLSLLKNGAHGFYWSTMYNANTYAYNLYFYQSSYRKSTTNRYRGLSVRPVRDK